MSHNYVYGDEISLIHLAEALPKSAAAGMAVWTHPWANIAHLTSAVYGIRLAEDVWHFPKRLFRPTSTAARGGPGARTVDFRKLRIAVPTSDAEGVVRRAKRMGWLYLHAPTDTLRSAITAVNRLQKFISIISLLAQTHVFARAPGDACPDGPMFFRELTRETFDQHVPVGRPLRNGVTLLYDLPGEIDDRLRFDVETYAAFWDNRAKKNNTSQGKHANTVSLTAVDDLNLSKLLAVCDTYRKYSKLLETIWNWLEAHRISVSGRATLADQVRRTFQNELLQPNRQDWLAEGLITDNEGTLTVPVYSNLRLVYRTVWDLVNRNGAIRTCINSINYSNAVFLAFLTALRSQELQSLPFDTLVSKGDKIFSHEHIVGQELKTNDQLEGITRDWPLPRAAVSLVTGTQHLHEVRARVLGTDIPKLLFNSQSNIAAPFIRMLTRERGYTGPKNNLIRRMRPSSAQLVADVSRSPLAVRTVLGHATIEESLAYCRGTPDDEYREMIEQRKRARDREIGKDMIAEVTGRGATDRMTRGVIKMGIDQIVALNLGDGAAVERARDLQTQIDKVKPAHFSEVYEMIGEDRWQIEEFIGESVAQPRPFQFCMAKKGGVHFSGACSTSDNVTNPKNCKSYCPYNFEAFASLELRANWVEKELSRGHFDDIEVNTEDPIFYNSAMKILDWVWSFKGPLARFKSDVRLINVVRRIAQDDDLARLFKGEARRTLQELGVL